MTTESTTVDEFGKDRQSRLLPADSSNIFSLKAVNTVGIPTASINFSSQCHFRCNLVRGCLSNEMNSL